MLEGSNDPRWTCFKVYRLDLQFTYERFYVDDRPRVGSESGTTRAEDAQGTPTQSHVSPSILVYEEKCGGGVEREFFIYNLLLAIQLSITLNPSRVLPRLE